MRWATLLLTLTSTASAPALPIDRVPIPAGAFSYGVDRDPDAEADEPRARSIFVAAFFIDRTEVTRAVYAACVASGRCAARPGLTIFDLFSSLPMTQVSWREARAFCTAVEARLPTEVEWERAARGSQDRRRYPWGDAPDCARANFGNFEGEGRCPDNPGRPVEVGRYPGGASPEGVLDLAGNVWEWTADLYDRTPRRVQASALGVAPRRAVRGGACCSMFGLPRLTNRVGFPEDYRDVDLGFRCASSATLAR